MTKHEKNKMEISQHLNAAFPFQRKQVEDNPEYKTALQKGDSEKALKITYDIIYGAADTKSEHTKLKEIKKATDDLLGI